MKFLLILFIPFLLAAEPSAAPPTLIEDLSDLPLLNPDLSDRTSKKLRLCNGLELLLISDPFSDQSAVSVAVDVGYWSDPPQYLGMAHFCEHMLFLGTQKYPDPNEFFTLLANYAGKTNAFTDTDRTVYMFSSQEEGFLSLLDRFAHFFIDPLFHSSNIGREMHAVDQEFALHKENDGWRQYMVFKEMGNPDHPHHFFSTGNSQTLSKIPTEALKKWHQRHYRPEGMHVAIYSSLPLDELETAAVAAFQATPSSSTPPPFLSTLPLASPQQKGHITYIEPVQKHNLLSLSWELPPELSDDEAKSAELIAYAIDQGHKQSLCEKLKQEQWIDELNAHVSYVGGKRRAFLEMDLELTQKGIEQIETVLLRCFQAIANIKKEGVPETLFCEKNRLAQLRYQYQNRTDAFSFISGIGRMLPDEPLSTFPRQSLLASSYSAEKIKAVAAFLTPHRCIVQLLAPAEKTKVACDKREKWLSVPYAIRPLPPAWLSAFATAIPHPDIQIASLNPFIPEILALIPDPSFGPTPVLFADSDFGIAYYARCPEFQSPETVVHFHFLSPEINAALRSRVFVSLYLDHLSHQLHPLLSAASKANLTCSFSLEQSHLHLVFSGFSEKILLLLQEVIAEMPRHPPTREQFDLSFARCEKEFSNREKALACTQAMERLFSLIQKDEPTDQEKLTALKSIRYEDFLSFHKQLFETSYLKALFCGNLSLQQAESSWLDLLHELAKTPYPPIDHPTLQVLHLPNEGGPYALAQPVDVRGNAALLLLDEGPFTFERRASQEILSLALKEPFFEELRTKQKTAYIATSQDLAIEDRLYQYFVVQSNSHQPEDLLPRFELFLEEYLQDFAAHIPEERFQTLRSTAITSLKTSFRNLDAKSRLWNQLAFEEKGDFAFLEKRIDGLELLDYETFVSQAEEFLSRANRKRLALLFKGKLDAPFSYSPLTLPRFLEVATYAPRMVQKEEPIPR